MFSGNKYRIIETMEEFLQDWDSTTKSYDNGTMPTNFSLEKNSFPLALKWTEGYFYWSGDWEYCSIEECISKITERYEDEIKFYSEKLEKIKNLKITVDKEKEM